MSLSVPSNPEKRPGLGNNRVAVICALVFAVMVGGAYASVPLYRAFCQATGYNGTISKANMAPKVALDKTLLIRFDTNIHGLPWTFSAEQTSQTVKIGETGLAYFKVTNNAKTPLTGHAVYNVVPEQAGGYFRKLECFCFSDQTIGPGQTIEFPVVYFVDPKYASDLNTRNKRDVTLSYTFYPAVAPKQASTAGEKSPSALGGTPIAGL
jgi:cytochrome c oxidase assembly protein subunit 11